MLGHLEGVFVEALLDQHFGPPAPDSETVLGHSEGHLAGLVQNLVAPPQLALILQYLSILDPYFREFAFGVLRHYGGDGPLDDSFRQFQVALLHVQVDEIEPVLHIVRVVLDGDVEQEERLPLEQLLQPLNSSLDLVVHVVLLHHLEVALDLLVGQGCDHFF